MFVVDTNILLYAAWKDSPEHQRALEELTSWRKGSTPWHITWGIAYEFLRVSTHSGVFREPLTLPEAWRFLRSVTAGPRFSFLLPTPRHQEMLESVVRELPSLRGNILHDAHTAALMREQGIEEIRTADTDFHAFPFIRVVNPLRARR